ncbi:MAG TPA: acetoacetate--CoA ligase [Gammaproteobacteria bacterium]|nr:acetoacetate--CoA ligase [Gammaproteobacteria bacterium]|tara:strand:- start:320 stop:2296 length:1977 start_codon:yes stop_codon:yes gene_type:complete
MKQSIEDIAPLWTPSDETIANANITSYISWLTARGIEVSNYDELWRWSVDHIEDFWESLWDYFELTYSKKWSAVLTERKMPGAEWFPGVRLNYAENIFARRDDSKPMLLFKGENTELQEVSWAEIEEQTRRLATTLNKLGVEEGDRVVAYLPNIPEAIVALLAVSSIGAIWSSCPPDFGKSSVLDRFSQIEPKVLLAVDGYDFGGKTHDRRPVLAEIQQALPTVEQTLLIDHISKETADLKNTVLWSQALRDADDSVLTFAQLPFDHPLWIVYSSGTTGLPKPIVHGHGGVILEHYKAVVFHNDIKPDDRFYWYSSTGWMMWNYLIGALFAKATLVIYNGSPAYPNANAQFELAEKAGVTYFGTSAAFISACLNAGIHPSQDYDLSAIRAVGSTGSPLSTDGFRWIYENINKDLALESLSGGTDLCTAFVGGARTFPIYMGEIQGASLGANVQAFDEEGKPIRNKVGELVITEPMPSMPLSFWNDEGMALYRESYFSMYPGIWRHGDWIQFNDRGGCVIFGRSDSTINRQGVRMGTSEIYRVVESFEEILDSLIIDLEFHGRESFMPLFLVLKEGVVLNEDLKTRIGNKLRRDVSPRHVPNEMLTIDEVPYTLSGKKMEVPIRKILLGMEVDRAANLGAMRNPEAIDFFQEYASQLSS